MSLVEQYHAEHKARQSRIEAKAFREPVVAEIVPEPEAIIPVAPPEIAAGVSRPLHSPAPERTEPLPPRKLAIREIIDAVAKHYNMTPLDIVAHRRTKDVVIPRQVAMFLCKKLTPRSFPWIGRSFSGRDHTTVLYSVNKIADLLVHDLDLATAVQTIRNSLPEYDIGEPEAAL